jgi:phosphoenolpyruvate synthase/pyruvate phosphate dikinase
MNDYARWLEKLDARDLPAAGNENATLGEMITERREENVRVFSGSPTTALDYHNLLEENELAGPICENLAACYAEEASLQESGKAMRRVFRDSDFPQESAASFGKRFDGISIGTNDLTQLILGVDRDAEAPSALFDERNDINSISLNPDSVIKV